jgi:hypothetical protein
VWSDPQGRFTWGSKSQVPGPTHVNLASPEMEAKSQLLSLHKSVKYDLYSLKLNMITSSKIFLRLLSRVGSRILLDPTLKISPKPHLQKVSSCKHPCHTWDLVWSSKSHMSCSQWLRLHKLTSSDLGLGIPLNWPSNGTRENYCIFAYLPFILHKILTIIWCLEGGFFYSIIIIDIMISFKDHESV